MRTAITWITICKMSGMYGAGFEVRWERIGDRYWLLRDRTASRYRVANERRGLTPISARNPTRNYALVPR